MLPSSVDSRALLRPREWAPGPGALRGRRGGLLVLSTAPPAELEDELLLDVQGGDRRGVAGGALRAPREEGREEVGVLGLPVADVLTKAPLARREHVG